MDGQVKKFASKLKNAKVDAAVSAWHGLYVFESNVQRLQSSISPGLEASLSKKPGDRTFRDLDRIVPLIKTIKAYAGLQDPVIEMIARYCKLDILIESMELPRSPSDRNKVYSVISGRIKAVTGDWSDPQLMVLARLAADELLSIKNIHKDLNVDEEASAGLPFASDAARGTEGDKYEALMKLGLGSEYHHKRVRKRIWRQMIEVAHSGGMPSRQKALLMMEELGIAADSLVEGEKKPGPASATGSSLLDIDEGQSFSGWDLDCRAEGGAKLESVVQLPPKIQGAVTEQNSLAALVYVAKGVYKRALQLQLDLMIKREVDACCRFPFLRHTPLKEMFDLARHLQVVTLKKGDVLLSQGKESLKSPVYFLLEGEVELCVDLPHSQDPQEISNALAALLGSTGSGGHNRTRSQTMTPAISPNRPIQRVVLGKRSSGVILGDEALRDDRIMLTVVATTHVKALSIPSSRFSSSLDPLTQRLFQKPRTQKSTAEFVSSLTTGGAGEARRLLERCRSEILALTYEGTKGSPPLTLNRSTIMAPKAWLNAGDSNTLSRSSPSKAKDSSFSVSSTKGMQVQPLTTGLHVSRFADVTASDSMTSFVSAVKDLEDERKVKAVASMARAKEVDPLLDALGLSRRLDLTQMVDRGASHGRYTELYEAGCLAIVRVIEKPGQGQRPALSFALSMDEIIAEWQAIAHNHGLQIVRWSCHEFYLLSSPLSISSLGANDPANTSTVRTMADSILAMLETFENINGRSEVNFFRAVASITIGPLFVSFDCGRFVVGLSGQAFDAASVLCNQLSADNGAGSSLRSTISISDGVMAAISRSHNCTLSGSSYELLGPTMLPHGTTFLDLFRANEDMPCRAYHYCNGGSLHCAIDDGLGGSSLDSLAVPCSNRMLSPRLTQHSPPSPELRPGQVMIQRPFNPSKVKSLWGKGSPRPSTLEPCLSLTKTTSMAQKASAMTAMTIRQKLRKELEEIKRSQGKTSHDPILIEAIPAPPMNSKTSSWKDCGASRALSEFISDLDESILSLSLSASGLKIFPDLSRLRYLQSLAASFNQFGLHSPSPVNPICTLPSSLRTLSLSHNGISLLPDDFGSRLPLLVDLNLSSNCLTSLPSSLSAMTSLKALSLQLNGLTSIDESAVNALNGLTALYLGQNELTSIGDSMTALSCLTALKTLDVSMNALEFLPPSLSHLPSLQTLLAGHNLLETLPNGFLSTSAHITRLELQGNRLCHCPTLTGFDECLLESLNQKYSDDAEMEDIDEEPPAPTASFAFAYEPSFSAVMSGPSYGRAPSFFRSKSLVRGHSMRRMDSKKGPPTSLAYTPTPEPHLGAELQNMTPCQLASFFAQDPDVIRLPHLVALDLSSNGLLALPPWLPPSLLSLAASNNRLESVHAWVADRLIGLKCIDLQSNRIKHLSRSLTQLNEIACVCLADNPCSDLDAAAAGAEMASWLEDHVIKLKYNKKVQAELN